MALRNFTYPYPDEFWFSWVVRYCGWNALPVKVFFNTFIKHRNTSYIDFRKSIIPFLEVAFPGFDGTFNHCIEFSSKGVEPAELFLKGSVLPFEFLGRTYADQARIISEEYPSRSYISSGKHFFKGINLCPDCMKEDEEDYGAPYIHRNHQLSGVTVCHKHGCGLVHRDFASNIDLIYNNELWYDLSNCVPVDSYCPSGLAQKYAVACATLAEAMLKSDFSDFMSFAIEKVKDRGFGHIGDDNFKKELLSSEYRYFYHDVPQNALLRYIKAKGVGKMRYIVGLLLYLTDGDISEYIDFVRVNHEESPVKSYKGFDCLGFKDLPFQVYRHNECGTVFFANEWWLEHGLGCPFCCKDDGLEDFCKKVLSSNPFRFYEFVSFDSRIRNSLLHVRHKICGKENVFNPMLFIFGEDICSCQINLSINNIKDLVSKVPNLKFLEYNRYNRKLRVYDYLREEIVDYNLEDFLATYNIKVK